MAAQLPGRNQLGREIFHLPPPSDDMKNAGNHTSAIPQGQFYIRLKQKQQLVTV